MSLDMEDFTLDMLIAQAKAAQLKKETDAEKLPALFNKTLDALVSACEKLEAITAERDQLATQVEMLKSFISQQAIPNLLVLSADYPQCLGIDSAITDAEELVKMAPVKCLADIRAKAVMNFAELPLGAYLSGFVTAELTVYDVYQSARNHVKDSYGYDTQPWDDDGATTARNSLNELSACAGKTGFIAGVIYVNPTAEGRKSLADEANKYADSIRKAAKDGE
ncbi:hypothetical protein ACRN9F_14295 [Shewanella oncorhynchi]|uniref:hypothetical protein n=1 Tax=Shewanella oncorhynchi TaxID=2726434 RepID=UPI003D7BC19B